MEGETLFSFLDFRADAKERAVLENRKAAGRLNRRRGRGGRGELERFRAFLRNESGPSGDDGAGGRRISNEATPDGRARK